MVLFFNSTGPSLYIQSEIRLINAGQHTNPQLPFTWVGIRSKVRTIPHSCARLGLTGAPQMKI